VGGADGLDATSRRRQLCVRRVEIGVAMELKGAPNSE
jgi:hypothetical protein